MKFYEYFFGKMDTKYIFFLQTEESGFCFGVSDSETEIKSICELANSELKIYGEPEYYKIKNGIPFKCDDDVWIVCESAYGHAVSHFADGEVKTYILKNGYVEFEGNNYLECREASVFNPKDLTKVCSSGEFYSVKEFYGDEKEVEYIGCLLGRRSPSPILVGRRTRSPSPVKKRCETPRDDVSDFI